MNSLPRFAVILPFVLLVGACGEENTDGFYSKDDAKDRALKFQALFVAAAEGAALDELVGFCKVPFGFSGRSWGTRTLLRKNLEEQLRRQYDRIRAGDRIEIRSYRDLLNGDWPRGRSVPKAEREQEMNELGIEADGFVARIFSPPQRGWRIVLNPDVESNDLRPAAIWP